MLSKVCSRSHGQPPGARRRAMMVTARSNFAPVSTKVMLSLPKFPTNSFARVEEMRLFFSKNGRNVFSSALDARKLLPFAFILMLLFLVAMALDSRSRTSELLSSQEFVERTNSVLH